MGLIRVAFLLYIPVLGLPIAWSICCIVFLVREFSKIRFDIVRIVAVIAIQCLILSVPFVLRDMSLEAAGVPEFADCPDRRDDCIPIQRHFVIHFYIALLVGTAVWFFGLKGRKEVKHQA